MKKLKAAKQNIARRGSSALSVQGCRSHLSGRGSPPSVCRSRRSRHDSCVRSRAREGSLADSGRTKTSSASQPTVQSAGVKMQFAEMECEQIIEHSAYHTHSPSTQRQTRDCLKPVLDKWHTLRSIPIDREARARGHTYSCLGDFSVLGQVAFSDGTGHVVVGTDDTVVHDLPAARGQFFHKALDKYAPPEDTQPKLYCQEQAPPKKRRNKS